jgi:hypothetical protein
MSEEKPNEIDLKTFEAALASLAPRSDRLDRDRLMFLAGQQSRTGFQPVERSRVGQAERSPTKKSKMPWPTAFCAMTAVAAVLAIILAVRPSAPTSNEIATNVNGKNSPPTVESPSNHPPIPSIDDKENDKNASPLLAFVHSFLSGANSAKASELNHSSANPPIYPTLRDRMLRQGAADWRIADNIANYLPKNISEPSNRQDLLKEYLSELK